MRLPVLYLRRPDDPELRIDVDGLPLQVLEADLEQPELDGAFGLVVAPLEQAEAVHGRIGALPLISFGDLSVIAGFWPLVESLRLDCVLGTHLLADAALMSFVGLAVLGNPAPDPCPAQTTIDLSLGDRNSLNETLGRYLEAEISRDLPKEKVFQRRLVVEELLVNAIRHAFGEGLYDPSCFRLDPEHRIALSFARSEDLSVVEIRDSGGRLRADRVRRILGRQFNEDGLLEESGRGLFLAFTIGHLLCFDLSPGKSTRIRVYFRDGGGEDVSGLLIRE